MAGVIATLLAAPKTINIVEEDQKGPARHVYEELTDIQTRHDPTLESPYLKATGVDSIPAHAATCVSGNFTITVNFPNYGVAVTTGNILFNAVEATIQTAVDSALAGQTIVATYVAGDVDVALSQNLNDTVNAATVTANGTTVNGAYMTLATTDVDLGDDQLVAPTVTTPGTMNRPAEAMLTIHGVVSPASSVTPQGLTPVEGDYTLGDNPFSLSPGTQDSLLNEMRAGETKELSDYLRTVIGCV